uniref:AB hydrolase-1 domain-containing protein n=1 Tax=Globodera rostochiensis TaxID=31243 RepID=A0A914HD05_GLORO
MPNLIRYLRGPVVYRPYQSNLLESSGDKMFSVGAGIYNVCICLSPILVPYIASFSSSHHISLLRIVLMFYAVAYTARTIGRLTNAEYGRFIRLLERAHASPQNGVRDRLKHYDYQRISDLPPPLNWLRQCVAWFAANTFGRRMLFPGATALFHSLLNAQLVMGRRKLMDKARKRNVVMTEDGNKVDTIFINNRGNSACGDTLIICCEGNAGYYEMGIMSTPAKLGYSVLGWNLPGFAESTGTPHPQIILGSMEAVMQFAVEYLGFQPAQIVLFGWSIGGFPATWAAANYPQIKALILDASFDDLTPLAIGRMPSALEGLVRFTVRKHLNLPIAQQLQRYRGPVLLIRRWDDEIIVTEPLDDQPTRRASNRINHLLIGLLRSRHPGLLTTTADEDCVFEWLAHDPQTRLLVYPPEDSLGPTRLSAAEMEEEGKRQKFIRQLCTKYFVDFMDATHNSTLDKQHFQIPTSF